jgi:ATP-dependent helicase HrpB
VRLGALDARGLTELGRALARIPAHPRIARLLLEGRRRGCAGWSALAAALLSERDPFLRAPRGRELRSRGGTNRHHSDSDLLDRVVVLEEFERSGARSSLVGELNAGAAHFVLRAADQLAREAERAFDGVRIEGEGSDEDFLRAVLAAWPDRVARRRAAGDRRAVMLGGRGVRLADESAVLEHELFVCCEIDGGRRGERAEGLVRLASAIERDWLPADRLRTQDEVVFDRERERVLAVRRTYYEDLVLDEAPTGEIDDAAARRALAEAAGEDLARLVPLADEKLANFLARVRSLAKWMPELSLPAFDSAWMRAQLPELLLGCRTFDDARKLDWITLLRETLDWRQQQALEREAPERLQVPSGSWIRLDYAEGRAPALAVRIQEVFGLADTPRVAGGRIKVTLQLLAPNYRPQQTTEDLASFWNGAYQDIRKELRARYPKHAWPEDPWNAPAVRKGPSQRS